MGIFDNAKSILIGDKEVKSIEVDGGTIWDNEIEPSSGLKLYIHGDSIDSTVYTSSPNSIIFNGDGLSIDWGDSNTETYTGGKVTHNYSSVDDYEITITGDITGFGLNCFMNQTSIVGVSLPNITDIPQKAFYNTSLTEIIIPDSVTSVGMNAFQNCSSLEKIVIPSNATLNGLCFQTGDSSSNGNIQCVIFKGSTPPISGNSMPFGNPIYSFGSNAVIRVPQGSLNDYLAYTVVEQGYQYERLPSQDICTYVEY